jgi:hypothetical protein
MEREEMTIEKEFMLRAINHKLVMLGFYLSEEYIKNQTSGDATIPNFVVQKQAPLVARANVERILLQGKLNEEYEKAWEEIKDRVPDNYCSVM